MKSNEPLLILVITLCIFIGVVVYNNLDNNHELKEYQQKYIEMQGKYIDLKHDSIQYHKLINDKNHIIDSLTKVKPEAKKKYESKIKRIYNAPDDSITVILNHILDSLYTHRFSKIIAK